jgi:hypothetical protein
MALRTLFLLGSVRKAIGVRRILGAPFNFPQRDRWAAQTEGPHRAGQLKVLFQGALQRAQFVREIGSPIRVITAKLHAIGIQILLHIDAY